ncbi:MAG: hypothetical protein WDN46_19080 [Methylocella sp.]
MSNDPDAVFIAARFDNHETRLRRIEQAMIDVAVERLTYADLSELAAKKRLEESAVVLPFPPSRVRAHDGSWDGAE